MKKVVKIELDFLKKIETPDDIGIENKPSSVLANWKNGILLQQFFDNSIKRKDYLRNNETKQLQYKKLLTNNIHNIYINLKTSNKILCWGAVQSGKTNNIISLALHLLDNEYDIVIVLGGTTNLLYNQTNDRIRELKIRANNFLYLDKVDVPKVNITKALENEKKILINTLKSKVHLDQLISALKYADLHNMKLVVIDDESDFGSINIGKPISKLYSALSEISMRTIETKFLAVTATPYGNILSNNSNELMPEVIVKLDYDQDYTGLDFFNQNDYIYKILKSTKKELTENTFNKNLDSIKEGIKWYLSAASFYDYLNSKHQNFELLINIDLDSEIHNSIYEIVENEVFRIQNLIDLTFVKLYFKEQLNFYIKLFNLSDEIINDKFLKILEKILFATKIEILNGSNEYRNDFKTGVCKSKIIIGGFLISRGFTFDKLITEVMINSPENKIASDTLLQRARWFGYRKNNDWYKYMKVITNDMIKTAYIETHLMNKLINSYLNSNNVIINLTELKKHLKSMKFEKIVPTSGVKQNGK